MADLHTLTSVDIFRTICQSRPRLSFALTEQLAERRADFQILRDKQVLMSGKLAHRNPSGFPVSFDSFSPPIVCHRAEQLQQFLTGYFDSTALLEANGCYTFPKPSPEDAEQIKTAVRKMNGTPRVPDTLHAWTFFGQPIQQAAMGSVFIVSFPEDKPWMLDKAQPIIEQMTVDRPDLYFILMPADVKIDAIAVDELTKLRDRINAIIYDKERSA